MYLNCSIFLNQHLFFIFILISISVKVDKSNFLLCIFLVKWMVLVIWHIILYMHLHELVCSSPLSK